MCVCGNRGISSGVLHHPGNLKTAFSMSLVIIQAYLFPSCNVSRTAIPDPLPTFFSFKFLPRLLSHKTLCISLTLPVKQMAFPAAWPRLHARSLEGALRGAVERALVTTATALLFPSKARWAGGRNWEWIDWGQFWLLPYTSIWGYPAESARGRWEEHSKWE